MRKFFNVVGFLAAAVLLNGFFALVAYSRFDIEKASSAVSGLFTLWILFFIGKRLVFGFKRSFGGKEVAIQGLWKLEKFSVFDIDLKKYTEFPAGDARNYFEFHGKEFRTGDLDEKGEPQLAEFSPFSISGENIVFDSAFFKKAKWQFSIKGGTLELKSAKDDGSKAIFVFSRKNISIWGSMSRVEHWITLILFLAWLNSLLFIIFKTS